ncbi:hypothetical protein LB505_000620 [Fusarium chuoi]|nr:hypothetical protein LB505_000620 [Fusarium chuoi]
MPKRWPRPRLLPLKRLVKVPRLVHLLLRVIPEQPVVLLVPSLRLQPGDNLAILVLANSMLSSPILGSSIETTVPMCLRNNKPALWLSDYAMLNNKNTLSLLLQPTRDTLLVRKPVLLQQDQLAVSKLAITDASAATPAIWVQS